MIGRMFLMLAAAAFGVEDGAPLAPLTPAGKWTVDTVPSGCRANRTFGAAEDVVLRIIAKPITSTYFVSVTLKAPISISYNDPVRVTLEPGGRVLTGSATGFSPLAGRPVLVGAFVDSAPFAASSVSAIGFSVKDKRIAYLTMDHVPALLAVLKTCENEMLAKFGVDLAGQQIVATPPEPILTMESLFRSNDYPVGARRAGAEGVVAGRFRVTPDGSVTDCVVISGSGNAELDQGTCAIWLSRAKFKPALSKDGQPVASAQIFSLHWSLPYR